MKLSNLPFFLTYSFVTTDARLLRGDDIVNHSTVATPDCDNARPNVDANQNQNQMSVKSSQRRLRQPPLQEYDNIKAGDWVEIYEPEINSSYAFFAKVLGIVPQDNGSVKFMIKSGPHDFDFVEEVDSSGVRVHEPYEFNTPAMCDYNGGKYGPAKLAPCTILSQHHESQTYFVLAELMGTVKDDQLPVERIRRLVDTSPENFRPGITHPDPTSMGIGADDSSHRLSGVVEMYPDGADFADPAIVTGYENKGSPTDFNYSLQDTTSNNQLPRVDPKFVHPYQIYEAGTEALCTIGGLQDTMNMVPCTVQSHSLKDIGFVDYQVSYYLEGEPIPRMATMSFAKINRRLNAW